MIIWQNYYHRSPKFDETALNQVKLSTFHADTLMELCRKMY